MIRCKLFDGAFAPKKAHHDDAAFDLFARDAAIIPSGAVRRINIGVAIEIPPGYMGLIKERSSMGAAKVVTAGGVIDAGYRGSLQIVLVNGSDEPYVIETGQRIAQLIILKIHESHELEVVKELSPSTRGEGGFGSTGA